MKKIQEAKNICCYGLGKLFQDHFYSMSIDNTLWKNKVNLLSDSKHELWGQTINGIPIVSPQELSNFENLLVITHVLHDASIKKSLAEYGIDNVINIFDLFELVGQRYEVSPEDDVFFY